jgi:hypothetical protein
MATNVNWDSLIKAAVNEGIKQVADKKGNDLAAKDIPTATKTVTDEVQKQVAPVIENQMNQEPVWKSRILRGAVVGLLSLGATVLKDYNDDGVIPITDMYGYGTTALGLIYVIYGRLTGSGTPTI